MVQPLRNNALRMGILCCALVSATARTAEAARVAHEGFPDPDAVNEILTAAGHVPVTLTAMQVERGALLANRQDVFLVGRNTTYNGASSLYVQQVGRFVAAGGNIVTEYTGMGMFFSSYAMDVMPVSTTNTPQLAVFNGIVHGGAFHQANTPVNQVDPTHPVVAGLPNPFAEFDGEDYFFWVQTSDPRLHVVGDFMGNGSWGFPHQHLPCLLTGCSGNAKFVFATWDWSDTIGVPSLNRRLFLNSVKFALSGCNRPPVANPGGPYAAECAGGVTSLTLDGTRSSDPDGDQLTYRWSTDCPGASFDNSTSPTPVLSVSSAPGCHLSCNVTLTVSDGMVDNSKSTMVGVSDSLPPVIALRGAGSLVLEAGVDGYLELGAAASDRCDQAVGVVGGGDLVNSHVLGTYVVTYNATDSCGHAAAQVTRTVRVLDTLPPLFTVMPNDLTVECEGPDGASSSSPAVVVFLNTPVTSDACDGRVPVTNDAPASFPLGDTRVTWTARDRSGNLVTDSRMVHVLDTTPPFLTCPADVTLECPADTGVAATGTASGSDRCGAAVVAYSDSLAAGCFNSHTISRTWTATDAFGNSTSCVQTIRVVDTTPPVIALNGPASMVLQARVDSYTEEGASASDGCDPTVSVTLGGGPVQTRTLGTYVLTYNAVDACGNRAAEVIRTVRVVDTIPPMVTDLPADLTLECEGPDGVSGTSPAVLAFLGMPQASDACDGTVPVTNDGPASFSLGDTRVTWTARDKSGNAVTASRWVRVVDRTPPVVDCPADVVLSCPADTSPAANGSATASDPCGGVSVGFSDVTVPGCGLSKTIRRTWTAADDFGNTSSCVQTIQVVDRTAPVIALNGPGSMVLESGVDSYSEAGASAADGCDGPRAVVVGGDVVDTRVRGTYVVTYSAEDACGNTAAVARTVKVMDTIPPMFTSLPNDLTVACADAYGVQSSDPSVAAFLATPRTSDACDGTVPVTSDAPSAFPLGDTLVTWTARDRAGNVVTASRWVQVVDRTPPVLVCPPDVSLECPADTSVTANGVATATDNCSGAAITYSDVMAINGQGLCTISRTWTATDGFGNSSSCVQTLRVVDTTPPVVSCWVEPTGRSREFVMHFSASDNCGTVTATAVVDTGCVRIPVVNGQTLKLSAKDFNCNGLSRGSQVATLVVNATDKCGNRDGCQSAFSLKGDPIPAPAPTGAVFLRGDASADRVVTVADPVLIVNFCVKKGPAPHCKEAADANDDGKLDLLDAVYLLKVLLSGDCKLSKPFPVPGVDPTPDGLGCKEYPRGVPAKQAKDDDKDKDKNNNKQKGNR